jgi:hypothetical protein
VAGKWVVVFVVVAAVLVASCSRSTPHVDGPRRTTHTLEFREVIGTYPCNAGNGVTPPVSAPSVARFDRTQKTCYRLGPILLTGHSIETAQAVLNRNAAQWEVDVHFANDDFVHKVATPEVGKNIAIVLDGVVQSTPRINPGITGRDVTISGSFDKAAVRGIAAAIAPPGTSIDVPATSAPIEATSDAFTKRCTAVARRLGFDTTVMSASAIPVGMARSAFTRARLPIPDQLAQLDDHVRLALCEFMPAPKAGTTTPTTVCEHGETIDIGTEYAVDEHLTATKLPGLQYLMPEGIPADLNLGICGPLTSP